MSYKKIYPLQSAATQYEKGVDMGEDNKPEDNNFEVANLFNKIAELNYNLKKCSKDRMELVVILWNAGGSKTFIRLE